MWLESQSMAAVCGILRLLEDWNFSLRLTDEIQDKLFIFTPEQQKKFSSMQSRERAEQITVVNVWISLSFLNLEKLRP